MKEEITFEEAKQLKFYHQEREMDCEKLISHDAVDIIIGDIFSYVEQLQTELQIVHANPLNIKLTQKIKELEAELQTYKDNVVTEFELKNIKSTVLELKSPYVNGNLKCISNTVRFGASYKVTIQEVKE